jgi:transcriptional regulator with XRE-family HTH domain
MENRNDIVRRNLIFLRKQKNWSQSRVADVLGYTRSTINKYENERLNISLEQLDPLAKLFDVTVEQLLSKDLRASYRSIPPSYVSTSSDGTPQINTSTKEYPEVLSQLCYLQGVYLYMMTTPQTEHNRKEIQGRLDGLMELYAVLNQLDIDTEEGLGFVYQSIENHVKQGYLTGQADFDAALYREFISKDYSDIIDSIL